MPVLAVRRWSGWLGSLVLLGALGLVYGVTLASGLTWAHDGADGGDLIAAAASGGVAHPTGYPLYLLLARLFLKWPGGLPAQRVTVLSAVCGAAAAVLVAAIVRRAYGGQRWAGQAGGWLAGFAFGVSPLLWSQAVIAEVYSLHAFLIALGWLALPIWKRAPASDRRLVLAGLALGAALGNHATALFMLPPGAAAVWSSRPTGRWRGLAIAGSALLVTAGALYGLLPIWASSGAAVNWGNAASWSGWLWVVTAQPYQGLAFSAWAALGQRFREVLGLWVTQFGAPGVLVGVGALFLVDHQPALLRLGLVWLFAICTVFAVGYNTADSYNYLTPAFLAFAVELGLGLARLLEGARHYHRGLVSLSLACMVGCTFWNAVPALALADASRDETAEHFIQAVARAAPANSLIITAADRDSFALWYMREALGERRDVIVLVERLWPFDWYRVELAAQYPDLRWPSSADPDWQATLKTLNDRQICRTSLDQPQALTCERP